jgi:hypothetical protein
MFCTIRPRSPARHEALWCFGVKSGWAVNYNTAVNLGVKP